MTHQEIIAMARAVELPEPVGYRNPFHTYSLMTADQIRTNEFQYSNDFLLRHTEPIYTADQLRDYGDRRAAAEQEAVTTLLQDYPHWLGNTAKKEISDAIRARTTP